MTGTRALFAAIGIVTGLMPLISCRVDAAESVRQFCDETHVGDALSGRLEDARRRSLTLHDHRADLGKFVVKSEPPSVAYCEIEARGANVDSKRFRGESW